MTIAVKTERGTVYEFTQKEERICFRSGSSFSGEVVRFNSGIICVGKGIDMDLRKYNLYNELEENIMFCKTSPVVEITVSP